jgi:hypothetical protein
MSRPSPQSPAQPSVVDWVQQAFPSLGDFCIIGHETQGEIVAWRCQVPETARDEVAWRIAVGHAARTLSVRPDLFAAWFGSANGCFWNSLGSDRYASILRYGLLVDVGTPDKPTEVDQFYGFLGESVLHELLAESDRGLGKPLLVEGHDWSVNDHGGDKLAIYQPDGDHAFRLWESKARRSEVKKISTVVADAADQLEVRALSYLGRFAVTAGRAVDDEDLAHFLAVLPDLWADNDPRAGLGVAVTTHAVSGQDSAFAQLEARFEFPAANKAGQLTLLGDLEAFGQAVRVVLWRGAGLWNAP